jgi:hypothetical protein
MKSRNVHNGHLSCTKGVLAAIAEVARPRLLSGTAKEPKVLAPRRGLVGWMVQMRRCLRAVEQDA